MVFLLSRSMPAVVFVSVIASAFLSGCVSDVGVPEPIKPMMDDKNVTSPKVKYENGTVTLSAASPARTFSQGTASANFKVAKNVTGFVVEVAWTAKSEQSKRLSIWVEPTGQGAISPQTLANRPPPTVKSEGVSPIRIPLNVTELKLQGDYDVLVRAAAEPVGVVADQPYTLAVSTFKDMAFNATFAALK